MKVWVCRESYSGDWENGWISLREMDTKNPYDGTQLFRVWNDDWKEMGYCLPRIGRPSVYEFVLKESTRGE